MQTTVARHLLAIQAVQLRPHDPFTWASGLLSPIYCDNRVALSHPAVRTYLKEALAEQSKQFDAFDVVAGVATAGIPLGCYWRTFCKNLLSTSVAAPKSMGGAT